MLLKSKFPELLTSESTTTPIGLNQRTLSSVSIFSGLLNIEPIPPNNENVITTKINAVNELSIIFLVVVKKLSAFDQIDCFSDMYISY